MAKKSIRIATRQSALAMWQTEYVKGRLESAHPGLDVEIVGITTRGDRIQDRPLVEVGGKGLFVKELEHALLSNTADIAVHSMKDVPMDLLAELEIPVLCQREDPRDAFVSNQFSNLDELPEGASVGTSSVRRKSQLAALRADLQFVDLRGNVDTRLRKLDEGQYNAIILAMAGLIRLGWSDRITAALSVEACIPSAGQGAVGIECRTEDVEVKQLITALNHADTFTVVSCERALSRRLQASCEVPVAAYAQLLDDGLRVDGMVASLDGKKVVKATLQGQPDRAESLGVALAEELLDRGAGELLPDQPT
jgi:hydroxymethylbilane synthase